LAVGCGGFPFGGAPCPRPPSVILCRCGHWDKIPERASSTTAHWHLNQPTTGCSVRTIRPVQAGAVGARLYRKNCTENLACEPIIGYTVIMKIRDMTFEQLLALPRFQRRFWAKVEKVGENDCWVWLGSLDKHGYGQVSVGVNKGRIKRAHRVAFQLTHGYCPPMLDHFKCYNRACCNPKHLRATTQKENSANRSLKRQLYRKRYVSTSSRVFEKEGIQYHEETRLYVIHKKVSSSSV